MKYGLIAIREQVSDSGRLLETLRETLRKAPSETLSETLRETLSAS